MSESISKMLILGSELTLAVRVGVQDFWGKFEVLWEGLPPLELHLCDDVGTGTTVLLVHTISGLGMKDPLSI